MSAPTGQGNDAPPTPRFPFRRLFVLAVLQLHLRPDEFWQLTPCELFALLRPVMPPAPPDRATLNDLLRRYGDEMPTDRN